ncbi:unnamed protein product [Triticum turgidum subsp. durum]|uniref:Crossover junction endonuclease MUS81 n=1 Tax=Triticum turgidum subsp. durum TaxID=4567 RepID=A0A9R0RWA0_TRITD|nr:unnamed protein product [Triticum turgidum subsp. durum]
MAGSPSPLPNPKPQSPSHSSSPLPVPHFHAPNRTTRMAPSVPKKKRKVNLRENEEVAARIFEKHRSLAVQQPAGLPDHQGRALSTAYSGVCTAKEPIRTPGDLARLKCAFSLNLFLLRYCDEASPNNSRNSRNEGYSYTGWNSMKTLTNKDLVEKKSNPAKYYLTEKGKETARDCLARSGLDGPAGPLTAAGHPAVELSDSDSDEYDGSSPLIGNGHAINSPLSSRGMFGQQSFSAMGSAEKCLLAVPPHQSNESFLKAYEVVLILYDRDTFGPRSRRKVIDNIRSQFNIPVEIKHLPVGDALWIARHKELDTEYVLDFIVERKNVDDLLGSIKDNRYKDQKLRLKKCGLRKLIYLVEGDVNTVDGSESVKTMYVLFS